MGFSKKRKKNSRNHRSVVIKRSRPQEKRAFLHKNLKTLLVLLLVILVFSSVVYFLFFTDQFLVKNINIAGASETTTQEINSYLEQVFNSKKFLILKQNKTLNFPIFEAQKELLFEIPKIKKVSIETRMPNSLVISVQERKQEGIWCAYGNVDSLPKCYFYDVEGVIYEPAPNSIRGSLIKIIRDGRVQQAQMGVAVIDAELSQYLSNLSEALEFAYEYPSYLFIKTEDEIHVGFSGGWEAQFSRSQDLIESIENLLLVLEEEIGNRTNELEYVDLRLGNKVFYKYKEQQVISND